MTAPVLLLLSNPAAARRRLDQEQDLNRGLSRGQGRDRARTLPHHLHHHHSYQLQLQRKICALHHLRLHRRPWQRHAVGREDADPADAAATTETDAAPAREAPQPMPPPH